MKTKYGELCFVVGVYETKWRWGSERTKVSFVRTTRRVDLPMVGNGCQSNPVCANLFAVKLERSLNEDCHMN